MDNQYELQTTIRSSFRNTTLLLVEDNPEHCALMRTVLKKSMPEANLLVAVTHEQALSQLRAGQEARVLLPRLILLDLYLPTREQGLALLHTLKEYTSPYRLIPVTVLSHSKKSDDVQSSYRLGTNSYIVKPVDYPQWQAYFESLRQYWLYTVTLPPT